MSPARHGPWISARQRTGARLAFFLIQDGFDAYGALPNDLTLRDAGNDRCQPTSRSTARSPCTARRAATSSPYRSSIPTLFSIRRLGTVQVLSGVTPGGRELQIGFEDVSTVTGDNDFQDVVIGIRTLNDDILIL